MFPLYFRKEIFKFGQVSQLSKQAFVPIRSWCQSGCQLSALPGQSRACVFTFTVGWSDLVLFWLFLRQVKRTYFELGSCNNAAQHGKCKNLSLSKSLHPTAVMFIQPRLVPREAPSEAGELFLLFLPLICATAVRSGHWQDKQHGTLFSSSISPIYLSYLVAVL